MSRLCVEFLENYFNNDRLCRTIGLQSGFGKHKLAGPVAASG